MSAASACPPSSTQAHFRTKLVDNVLVVTLDTPNSKVNSLGQAEFAEFDKIIGEIETNPAISAAVLISSKPGCFVAGADIGMLEKCKSAEEATALAHKGQIMFDRMEQVSEAYTTFCALFDRK